MRKSGEGGGVMTEIKFLFTNRWAYNRGGLISGEVYNRDCTEHGRPAAAQTENALACKQVPQEGIWAHKTRQEDPDVAHIPSSPRPVRSPHRFFVRPFG